MPRGERKAHSALHRHVFSNGITPARGFVILWRQMDIAKDDIRPITVHVLYGNTLPVLDEYDKRPDRCPVRMPAFDDAQLAGDRRRWSTAAVGVSRCEARQ